jgi:glyoxylase-like metal-dependent hydrolase (beta-lactamase superfamily II)
MFTSPNLHTTKWNSLRTFALALPLIAGAVSVSAAETAKSAAMMQSTFTSAGSLKQAPQFYSVNVGGAKITAISDGTIPLDANKLLQGKDTVAINKLLDKSFVSKDVETSINVYLIEIDGHRILVDTGAGDLFGEGFGGRLFENLKAVGVAPEQITDVLITHVHVDHTGGLTLGGKRMFPNALVYVGKPDVDFFLSAEQAAKSTYRPAALPHAFEEAVTSVKPYLDSGQLRPFDRETEIVPGLNGTIHPGHTPGSAYYTLTRNGQTIKFIGDTVHVEAVQFPAPEVTIVFDVNAKEAAANRAKVFAELARTRVLVAAPHLRYPGIGHIRAEGKGYSWVPEVFADRAVK